MFSVKQKQKIAAVVEECLLEIDHPEMPTSRPKFSLHVDGKKSWSWADIEPNWTYEDKEPSVNPHNELQDPPIEGQMPVGSLLHHNEQRTLPDSYLLTNGDTLLIKDYPKLYAIIGDKYGEAPDGKFVLLDTRPRPYDPVEYIIKAK